MIPLSSSLQERPLKQLKNFLKNLLIALPFRRLGLLSAEHVATLQSDTLLFGKSMDLFFQLGLRDQILDLHGRVGERVSVSTSKQFR